MKRYQSERQRGYAVVLRNRDTYTADDLASSLERYTRYATRSHADPYDVGMRDAFAYLIAIKHTGTGFNGAAAMEHAQGI